MGKRIRHGIALSLSLMAAACSAGENEAGPDSFRPTRVFLDTDLGIDPGDMGAVAMIHGLADRCEVDIVGMTIVSTAPSAAGALDATNHYYGRPDIQNADENSGPRLGWDQLSLLDGARPESPYWRLSDPGSVTVGSDGRTTWHARDRGLHRVMRLADAAEVPSGEAAGVPMGGPIASLLDNLEANAGRLGACRPTDPPASKE